MKVICIYEAVWDHQFGQPVNSPVKVGEVYNVIKTDWHRGIQYYELLEVRGIDIEAKCFALLSDIDETEMIREYKRELTPERLLAHQRRWYSKRLKEETRIEARSFLRSQLYFLKRKIEQ